MSAGQHIMIVGAGLGGALMACFLARAGFQVSVYERRSDPRAAGFAGGRSINLALSARGLHALREVGLADQVLRTVIPMPGRMIHDPQGGLHFQAYSKDPADRINSVSRSDLNLTLLHAAASHKNVSLHFDHRCASIDFTKPAATFETPDGSRVTVEADRIIGADGAFSAVRLQMMLGMDRMEYSQHYLAHGYKELTIPPAERCGVDPQRFNGFAMEPNALHIWPRGSSMMIALPNQDRSFTCTCFWPFTGPNGFDALRTEQEVREHFQRHFPDAAPLMPTLAPDYFRNPTGSLVTVRCEPWYWKDKAVLIGDAAHAIVPFYGQGANAAFEDCVRLMERINAGGSLPSTDADWLAAFAGFSAARKPDADAIADMAYHNFIEMRDKTASPLFRAKKKLEHALHAVMPGWFTPLYNMISFSTIPYAQAKARAARQSAVIAMVIAALGIAILTTIVVWIG